MSNKARDICFLKLPDQPKLLHWVQLIPAAENGLIIGRDGRKWILQNPEIIINNFRAGKTDLPVDVDHALDVVPDNGLPKPVYGWIKELENRSDGIWGLIEWTEDMLKLIQQRKYRYISPVLIFNKSTRELNRIGGAGVTHEPNLYLKAFAHQNKEVAMQELLERIATALGLSSDTKEEDILKALGELKNAQPDPEKYVPIDQVKAMMQEQGQKHAEISEEKANNKVEQAIDDGYFTPAMRQWGRDLCRQNPQAFDDFIKTTTPQYAHLFEPSNPVFDKDPCGVRKTHDEYERSVNEQLGIEK